MILISPTLMFISLAKKKTNNKKQEKNPNKTVIGTGLLN